MDETRARQEDERPQGRSDSPLRSERGGTTISDNVVLRSRREASLLLRDSTSRRYLAGRCRSVTEAEASPSTIERKSFKETTLWPISR